MNNHQKDFAQLSATLSATIITVIEAQKMTLEVMCKVNEQSPKVAEYLFNKTMLEVLERFPSLQDGSDD